MARPLAISMIEAHLLGRPPTAADEQKKEEEEDEVEEEVESTG